jgi:hypothetical protein
MKKLRQITNHRTADSEFESKAELLSNLFDYSAPRLLASATIPIVIDRGGGGGCFTNATVSPRFEEAPTLCLRETRVRVYL